MIDDLLEVVLDAALEIGGEVVGAVAEHKMEKRRQNKKGRQPDVKEKEPWERGEEKTPWEG
ncbi:MAG: hypothetical protein K2K53_08860 [Oscillospiraceae bacterium]|nr:hypothetical protein [Oscillospiraceae bacterium]